uniref:Uncharacterized protein n=1 Tax=uncultured marine virus TaxID=186617 RepID=A0A0F7L383_9VIRU|nr:hypothetical protein [uncultured marine virus]
MCPAGQLHLPRKQLRLRDRRTTANGTRIPACRKARIREEPRPQTSRKPRQYSCSTSAAWFWLSPGYPHGDQSGRGRG